MKEWGKEAPRVSSSFNSFNSFCIFVDFLPKRLVWADPYIRPEVIAIGISNRSVGKVNIWNFLWKRMEYGVQSTYREVP